MIRRTLACSLILTLSWTGWAWAAGPAFAQATPQPFTYELAMERLDRFVELIEELRSHIDRSQFDLEALLDKLDYDPERIADFVKTEIRFEQYPGLLRGAMGTLMSGAGNSLDQSVLLATLLRDSGYEARISRGSLSTDLAQSLVEQMRSEPVWKQEIWKDPKKTKQTLHELAQLGSQGNITNEILDELVLGAGPSGRADSRLRTAQVAESLESVLSKQGFRGLSEEKGPTVAEEARDYFWVEYRSGSSDPWIQTHPAVSTATIPMAAQADEFFAGAVPEALVHKFRLEGYVDRLVGRRAETLPLFSAWERPVANLLGTTLTYSNMPDNRMALDEDLWGRVATADLAHVSAGTDRVSEASWFVPMIQGRPAAEGSVFDLQGNLVPLDAAMDPAAGIFQTDSKKLNDAVGALSSIGGKEEGSEQAAMTLLSQRLVITILAPDGSTRVAERIMYSVAEEGPRQLNGLQATSPTGTNLHSMMDEYSLMISPGQFPRAYVLSRYLSSLTKAIPMIAKLAELSLGTGNTSLAPARKQLESWAEDLPEDLPFLTAFGAMSEWQLPDEAYLNYPARPLVIGLRTRIKGGGELFVEDIVDVVFNERRILEKVDGRYVKAIDRAILQGVWDTEIEDSMHSERVAMSGGELVDSVNSWSAMSPFATGQPSEYQTLMPSQLESVRISSFPSSSIQAVERDLRAGYVVLIPKEHSSPPVWWRVHPDDGTTLGMGGTGMGISVTQYIINWTGISSVAIAIGRMWQAMVFWYLCMAFQQLALHSVCGSAAGRYSGKMKNLQAGCISGGAMTFLKGSDGALIGFILPILFSVMLEDSFCPPPTDL